MAIKSDKAVRISQKHLLGIQDLSISDVNYILSEANQFIKLNRSKNKKLDTLRGKTQINLFFEPSTRTQSSFELAGKRLGADVMSMNIVNSAIKKGETFSELNTTCKRPEGGISPICWNKVIGKKSKKIFKVDEFISL